jgi:hypothetical protein
MSPTCCNFAKSGNNEINNFEITRVNLGEMAGANQKKVKEVIDITIDDIPDVIMNVDTPSMPLKSAESIGSEKMTRSPDMTLLNISPAAKSFSKYLKT